MRGSNNENSVHRNNKAIAVVCIYKCNNACWVNDNGTGLMSATTVPGIFRDVMSGDSEEVSQASQVLESAADYPLASFVVRAGEVSIDIPSELGAVLGGVIATIAAGGIVQMRSMPAELTTTVAAESLSVSRPTLMKMIKEGQIPSHKVGSHTRVKRDDIIAFKNARMTKKDKALAELNSISDELGEQ